MQNILTGAFEQRKANIAKGIGLMPENPDLVYELIKSATPEQKRKVKKVMDEWKSGTLHSGSKKGPKITDYKQALAVAMSESGLHKSTKKDDELCKHGESLTDCEICNPVDLKKDMEMGSGDADGYEASVEKSNEDDLEKAVEDLFGIQDPIEKAFNDIIVKGGPGSGRKFERGDSFREGKNKYHVMGYHDDGRLHVKNHTGEKFTFSKKQTEAAHEKHLKPKDWKKAFSNDLEKGGKGSNKAGRVIGTTRSGKNVHVFKEANDYHDFEAVDHLEAHKMHLHHAHKVTGVAAVNSRIRAHDHEDLARIKAAKKEQEENEKLNEQAAKNANGGKQTKTQKVKKALMDFLNRDEVEKAFNDVLEKGDIASSLSNYSDKQPILFSKTGKEIAAKLLAQAAILSAQEATLEVEMDALEEEIGEAPDDENCSYSVKTIKVPRYSYNCLYPKEQVVNSIPIPVDDATKTTAQLCSKYNDLSYRMVNIQEDLNAIRVITENLEGATKYKLSVGQLSSLGF